MEETLKRINSHKGKGALRTGGACLLCFPLLNRLWSAGVLGVVIVNSEGIPIRTTLERQYAVQVRAK